VLLIGRIYRYDEQQDLIILCFDEMHLTGAKCQEITNLESSAERVSSIMNAREKSPFVMMVLLLSEFITIQQYHYRNIATIDIKKQIL
jgi:hypothetical protein